MMATTMHFDEDRPVEEVLKAADAELHDYYTSSLGVKAQGYDPSGGGGAGASDRFLANAILAAGFIQKQSRQTEAVERSLEQLDASIVRELELAYTPRGWSSWAALMLKPRWAKGYHLALGCTTEAAREVFRKAFPDVLPTPGLIMQWLAGVDRPMRDAERRRWEKIFGRIRVEAERRLTPALRAYDDVRRPRVAEEKSQRALHRAIERIHAAAFVDRELAQKKAKRAERLLRRRPDLAGLGRLLSR